MRLAVYMDAHANIPLSGDPLRLMTFCIFGKTDTLKGIMWFSYEQNSMAKYVPSDLVIEFKEIYSP